MKSCTQKLFFFARFFGEKTTGPESLCFACPLKQSFFLKVPKNIGKHNDWVQSIFFFGKLRKKKSFIGKKSYTRVKNFLLQDEKLERQKLFLQGGKTGFGVEFECPRRKQQTQTQTQMSWIPHPHKVC